MTKREAILSSRLAAAHRFIYGQMKHAEDYGSQFSAGVFFECEAFLKANKAPKEGKVVVVPKERYDMLCRSRLEALKAKLAQPNTTVDRKTTGGRNTRLLTST